ncbi:MAG: hypothetical protein QOH99_108, partial [Frankiaceae bacterium]|nr:hypothetical protein [Frankiaceae bacterium]
VFLHLAEERDRLRDEATHEEGRPVS